MNTLNELEVILRDNSTVTGADALKKIIESEVENVIDYSDTGEVIVNLHTQSGIQGAAELISLHIEAATKIKVDASCIIEEIHHQLNQRK